MESPIQRELFLYPDTQHPAIRNIGVSNQLLSRAAFGGHRHDCFEICLISDGSIDYFTEQQRYTIHPNAVQISKPDELHGTPDKRLHPCTLRWIQIDFNRLEAPELQFQISELPSIIEQAASTLIPYHEAIIHECRDVSLGSYHLMEGMLLTFLVKLIRSYPSVPRCHHYPTTLVRALDLIKREPSAFLTVESLAEKLNTHRAHLHKLFTIHLAVSPQAYISEQRLSRAASMLGNETMSITEIAHQLGFSSSQHLATAFRKRFGTTPSQAKQHNVL